MSERVQMGIRVREIDTTVGSMFEPICALHGAIPATFDEETAIRRAALHAAYLHGTTVIDIRPHYLNEVGVL